MDEKSPTRIEEISEYLNQAFGFIEKAKLIKDCRFLLSELSRMEEKVKELEYSLFELNGKYTTRIKELYETEQEREHISKELIKERMKVMELRDAVDRHEAFKRTHEKVVSLEDEELYQTKKEIV